jgi:class 3 adenylate cyclase
MMICPNCGTENSTGRRFCGGCAAPLERQCPACGAANEPEMRFCGACAQPLNADSAAVQPASSRPEPPAAERRLVSVLFADLVGFTTLSESRDAEDVREILSRYFENCKRLIALYGGTVEKFIGDAVMSVWGHPSPPRTTPNAPFAPPSISSPPCRRSATRSARRFARGPAC